MSKARTYSRRGMALRRLALLLVLLVGSAALRIGIGSYCVTPEQALRRMQAQSAMPKLEVIYTQECEGHPKGDLLIQICRGGEYLLFNTMEFTSYSGWSERDWMVLEPGNPEERHYINMSQKRGSNEAWFFLFGFVPDGEEPPTFRVGVWNENAELKDGADSLLDTILYTPVPTIPVEGGSIFLEQHIYTMPRAEEDYQQEWVDIGVDVCYDGVWQAPHNWTDSNV